MYILNPPEVIAAMSPLNLFGRFPDDRPRMPDDLLEQKYTPGEIDVPKWREAIETDCQAWLAVNGT